MEVGKRARSENVKFYLSATASLNDPMHNAAFVQADRDKIMVGELYVYYKDKKNFS